MVIHPLLANPQAVISTLWLQSSSGFVAPQFVPLYGCGLVFAAYGPVQQSVPAWWPSHCCWLY